MSNHKQGCAPLEPLRRRAFEQILGPLQLIMNHDRRLREKAAYSQQLHAEAEHLLNTNLSDYSLCADVLADGVVAEERRRLQVGLREGRVRESRQVRVSAELRQLEPRQLVLPGADTQADHGADGLADEMGLQSQE